MSSLEAALIVTVVLAVALPALYAQIRRAHRYESTRDQLVRLRHERAEQARVQDPVVLGEAYGGWMPADVEDHLLSFLTDNPDVADGFARLRRLAEEQTRKDTA